MILSAGLKILTPWWIQSFFPITTRFILKAYISGQRAPSIFNKTFFQKNKYFIQEILKVTMYTARTVL